MTTHRSHRLRVYGDTTVCADCKRMWDTNDVPSGDSCSGRNDAPQARPTKGARKHRDMPVSFYAGDTPPRPSVSMRVFAYVTLAVAAVLLGTIAWSLTSTRDTISSASTGRCVTSMPSGTPNPCR